MSYLDSEKSPYLLQHADNPVQWYPWADQAFAHARHENKLIFLSIGYSTCHWCHVMAHECFEDHDVARLLNADYISIKVDREERPDIDQVYMEICQRMTGSGGWPLSIIMTPDARPFYAATYIPKNGQQGRPGMMQLLPWVSTKWREDPDFLTNAADEIVSEVQGKQIIPEAKAFNLKLHEQADHALKKSFDSRFGGFGRAPKFPRPHDLVFLLQRFRQTADNQSLAIVNKTLHHMCCGGIYDQLGSGFHRYSTDEKWLVPHFEKMLYDQAGLVELYLEAWQITNNPLYAQVGRHVLAYLQRDMQSPEGAFCSAEDADSEGAEGLFYLWKKSEIIDALGQRAEAFCAAYNLKEVGNYHDEVSGKLTGENILHLSAAQQIDIAQFEDDRVRLFDLRSKRVRPHLDDKIISAWNGMAISAFARAGRIFDEENYIDSARAGAAFILDRMVDGHGRLLRRFRQGEAAIQAFSEDYAFVVRGLLDLYMYDLGLKWLQNALELAQVLIDFFQDPASGKLYDTPTDGEKLLIRPISNFDGAAPAPGSIALEVFARLFLLTGDIAWRDAAERLMQSLSAEVSRYPSGYTQLLLSSNWMLRPSREIVIVGVDGDKRTSEMLEEVRKASTSQTVVVYKSSENMHTLARLAPFTADMTPVGGKPTAYVCQDFACQVPLTDVHELRQSLKAFLG
jgi:uncharacterized protein YyaL (SSP411 family)